MKKPSLLCFMDQTNRVLWQKPLLGFLREAVILTMPINIKTLKPMSFFNGSNGFLLETQSKKQTPLKLLLKSSLKMNTKGPTQYKKTKVALFVSKIDHCFHDIILRFQANEMSGELACIISNHKALEKAAAKTYGIPFYHHLLIIRIKLQSKLNNYNTEKAFG